MPRDLVTTSSGRHRTLYFALCYLCPCLVCLARLGCSGPGAVLCQLCAQRLAQCLELTGTGSAPAEGHLSEDFLLPVSTHTWLSWEAGSPLRSSGHHRATGTPSLLFIQRPAHGGPLPGSKLTGAIPPASCDCSSFWIVFPDQVSFTICISTFLAILFSRKQTKDRARGSLCYC